MKGESEKQMHQSPCMIMACNNGMMHENLEIMEKQGDNEDTYNTTLSSSSTTSSSSSFLIDDDDDDASSLSTSYSSSSSSSQSINNGSLYDLSELMTQLPIKRGLSKYFQGKSQSFTSLSSVKSIEELAKKESPYKNRRKMKACKSYGGGLVDAHKAYTLPKPTISKKVSSSSKAASSFPSSLSKFNRRATCKRPPLQNHLQC